ncbi:ABC transporter substrate-binding protein [Lysobacter sp. GX 14042]|uniref:siderophore ABC transporter substrate-binding protein n=1 Tax=Lysobacter sp. GX 14042 TaxID=2907155 RepID=UPI001F2AA5B5|nr:ABC transporter substrate-binding protein [Lysobacter sp. GX 14042]MCE7031927.1 ABC transporter substrate-binding protein [Lysobacter sp. GX 14042]
MRMIHLLVGALLAASGPLQAGPVEVEHAQGVTTVPAHPVRTVVFDLAMLDNLQALEVDVVGVPDARFPAHLAGFADARYGKVGTLFEPDLDAVRALEPDVILVGGRSASAYDALNAIAPTLDLTPSTGDFFNDVTTGLETLGRVYGRQELAAQRIAELRDRRDTVAAAAAGSTGLVLFTINGNVIAHAPGARFGIVHDALGLSSVLPAQAPSTGGPRPQPGSPEAAAAREEQARVLASALDAEPDWLLVLDRGLATGGADAKATELSAHEAVTATAAWQAGRVFQLDPPGWYLASGGYTVLRDTLEDFARRLAQ